MISPNRIYPPLNWQDFEMLCLKLWGEIWKVTNDIEFNSNNSSGQDGVDIFCIPKGESDYFGIQCKNRDLFRKNGEINKLTKSTIDTEVLKARKFKPALKKLIIATSCGKDKDIEEYVRKINLSNIKAGLFSVQVSFWDYFIRKIAEYENVYNWYVKNENFTKTKSALITYGDNKQETTHYPEFIKTKIIYRLETEEEKAEELNYIKGILADIEKEYKPTFVEKFFSFSRQKLNSNDLRNIKITVDGKDINNPEYIESTYPKPKVDYDAPLVISNPFVQKIQDRQELGFYIKITNNGDTVIEDFKLKFQIIGEFEDCYVEIPRISEINRYVATTWINGYCGLIEPDKNFLVQQDSFLSKRIIITPKKDHNHSIIIKWRLLSRDFNDYGELKLHIAPQYIEGCERVMFVLNEEDCSERIEYLKKTVDGFYTLNY